MNNLDVYKKKWLFLLLLVVGGLLVCYFLAFSKTIDLYKQYHNQQEQNLSNINKPQTIRNLQKEVDLNEKFLSQKTGADTIVPRQIVIDLLSKASQQNRFRLIEVSPSYTNLSDTSSSEITAYTLEGSYTELMKTWYFLEKNLRSGNIRSTRFFVKQDFKTHIEKLNMKLYVELLKKKD